MGLLLDATQLSGESELIEEKEDQNETAVAIAEPTPATPLEGTAWEDPDPWRLRKITIGLPDACETSVQLLVQRFPRDTEAPYRSGYMISRAYDCNPYEQSGVLLPAEDEDDELYRVSTLAEAIEDAADRARHWIDLYSGDEDEKAKLATDMISQWMEEADYEAVVFDPEPAEETQATEPAVETPQAAATEEAPATTPPPEPPAPAGITDAAQKAFDDVKHSLEEEIAELAVEQLRLKAAVKCNRETIAEKTEEYESHCLRGPVRLPLFDRQQTTDSNASPQQEGEAPSRADTATCTGIPADCTCPSCAQARTDQAGATPPLTAGDLEWSAVRLETLGLTPKILEILEGYDVRTMGELAALPTAKGCEPTALKGITEARWDKIQAAVARYWEAAGATPAAAE